MSLRPFSIILNHSKLDCNFFLIKLFEENNVPLNICYFDSIIYVEGTHQMNESLFQCRRNHDIHAALDTARFSPEIEAGALLIETY